MVRRFVAGDFRHLDIPRHTPPPAPAPAQQQKPQQQTKKK